MELREASMTNTWVTMELARAHYEACDRLSLAPKELSELGNAVGRRVANPFFGTIVRMAKSGGVTPWTPLARVGSAWGRAYRGSGITVYKLAPKDAELHIQRNELASIGYWVEALASLMRGTAEIFARKAFCKPIAVHGGEVRYSLAWA
ncbi:MAG: hypothetical protein AAGE52_09230 [Myxococcota bacterium]